MSHKREPEGIVDADKLSELQGPKGAKINTPGDTIIHKKLESGILHQKKKKKSLDIF